MAQHTFTSIKEWRAELQRRADNAKTQCGKATRQATMYFHRESSRRLQEYVYSVPVPTRADLWKRRHEGYQQRVNLKTGKARGAAFWKAKSSGRRHSNKPLWKRLGASGGLKGAELFIILDWFRGKVYNAKKYAAHRHWLKRTRFPGQIKAPAPWQTDTAKDPKVLTRLHEIYGTAGFNIVSGGD